MIKEKTYIPALKYNWLTKFYDLVIGYTMPEQAFKSDLIKETNVKPEMHILDFGCGTLTLSIMLKQKYQNALVTGIDVDKKILKIAESKRDKSRLNIRLDSYDGTILPYPDETFDRVLSSLVFHHLTTPQKKIAFGEIKRVLKSSGELHIADWGKPSNWLMRVLFFFLQLLDGFKNTSANVKGELPNYLTESGFRYVFIKKHYNTIFGTLELFKAIK